MISRKVLPLMFLPLLLIPAYAQEANTEIPGWVKGVANFWAEGNISDSEFAESITFLIEQNIIQISSVAAPQMQAPIQDEEKRLFELEIAQKDDRITILEKEVKDVGLDNAHLLNSIVEKEQSVESIETLYQDTKAQFDQYKKDYPLKIGNIGGKTVVDYIQELEDEIEQLSK